VAVALIQFATLVALAVLMFQVPLKGSAGTLLAGGLVYVLASTGFGLLISVFATSQTAAIFAAAIITILPAVAVLRNVRPGVIVAGRRLGGRQDLPQHVFPGDQRGYFHQGPGMGLFVADVLSLAFIALIYFVVSVVLLKKQER